MVNFLCMSSFRKMPKENVRNTIFISLSLNHRVQDIFFLFPLTNQWRPMQLFSIFAGLKVKIRCQAGSVSETGFVFNIVNEPNFSG